MLLTVKEFGKALGVDSSTVRRWIRNGALKNFITLPQRGNRAIYRIDEKHLHRILNTGK